MRPTALLVALAILAAPALPAAAAEPMPFVGVWDCEVGTFTFTNETYNPGDQVMPILEVEEKDGDYHLMFADDYSVWLSGISEESMGWLSGESGDGFTCTRLYR